MAPDILRFVQGKSPSDSSPPISVLRIRRSLIRSCKRRSSAPTASTRDNEGSYQLLVLLQSKNPKYAYGRKSLAVENTQLDETRPWRLVMLSTTYKEGHSSLCSLLFLTIPRFFDVLILLPKALPSHFFRLIIQPSSKVFDLSTTSLSFPPWTSRRFCFLEQENMRTALSILVPYRTLYMAICHQS